MPEAHEEITPDATSAPTPTAQDAAAAPQREADPVLLDSVEFARRALRDVTDDDSVGAFVGHSVEDDNAVSLLFENRLDGYPGWFWTVTLARVDDGEPTVLESELMPGDSALLAPDWVPWSERLAEYRAQQKEAAREAAEADDAAEPDDADDDESDDDDVDGEARRHLHAGDVDGVDVDEFAPAGDDDEVVTGEHSAGDDSAGDDAQNDDAEGERSSGDDGHRGSRRGGARGRRRSRGRRHS